MVGTRGLWRKNDFPVVHGPGCMMKRYAIVIFAGIEPVLLDSEVVYISGITRIAPKVPLDTRWVLVDVDKQNSDSVPK